MKKNILASIKIIYALIFIGGFNSFSFGQGTETFTNIPTNSSTSYLSRSWTGDDGSTWTATNARTDQTINGKAITLNDDKTNTYIESGTISGGVGDISVTTKMPYSDNGTGTVTLYINGSAIGTLPYGSSPQTTTFSSVNVSGNIVIKIDNSSQEGRVTFDDISWTAYGAVTPTITVSPTSLTGFTYVEGSGPSGEQSFTVEGSNLTNDITVTPVSNWEISTVSGGPYQTTTITLSESGGTVSTTTIYTRMISGLTNAGSPYSENIACESSGATTKNVAVDGTVTIVSSSCGSETFTSSNATGSYSDNSYVGDNGVTWNYIESRDESSYSINGAGIMLRGSGYNSKVYSSSVAGGIDVFTCKLKKGFTGSGNRQVELYVNGTLKGTSITWDNTAVQTFTVSGIAESGNVVVEIRAATNKQVVVDDIDWTCYSATPSPELQVQIPTGTDVACGDTYDFGTVVFGNNSSETLRIQNTGTADLNITSFPLTTGTEYGISPTSTSTTVTAGNNYDINVTYTPSGAGTFNDAITINNDDSDEGTCVINFTGIGIVCNTPTTESNTMSFTSVGSSSMTVNWTNGNGDNRIVVVHQGTAVTSNPVNGTTYSASSTYGSGDDIGTNEFVVYNGSGNSVTVNGLSASTTYYFKVFEYNCSGGNENYLTTAPLEGNQTTTVAPVAAVLSQGDIAVVGVCSNIASCVGGTSAGDDEISFVCFKDITTGTEIDMTDNGWERCHSGQWGNAEGYLRIQRTGGTIVAGTVITFRTHGSGTEFEGIFPDNGWSITATGGFAKLILNSNGDQIYFMQDGTWSDGTSGNNNATYTGGEVLFGFNTNDTWTSGICNTSNNSSGDGRSQNSVLYSGMDCFNMVPSGATDYLKYTGPTTPASQIEWVGRINDNTNWSSYANCTNYYAGSPDYTNGDTLQITTTGLTTTFQWYGNKDTEWFDCANWGPLRIPSASTDVVIPNSSQVDNDIVLNAGENAECKNFTVEDPNHTIKGENGSTKVLTVNGNLTINGGTIDFDDGNNSTTDGTIYVKGNWTNNNATTDFMRGNSTVIFNGNTTQTVTSNSGIENFANIQITGSSVLDLSGNDLQVSGNWTNYNQSGLTEGTSTITFDGTTNQNINTTGGEIIYDAVIDNPTTVTLSNNLTVSNQLNQSQGELVINGKTLTLQNDLIRTTGTFTGSNSSNMIINGTGNLATSLYFTSGSESLNNLTVNRLSSGTVTMGTNLTIYGQLGMTAGELNINDKVLTLNGTISGTGTLKGSANSELYIGGSGNLGTIYFSTGAQEVKNLTTNRSSGISTLGTDLTVNTLLTLTNGLITTGANNLIISTSNASAVTGQNTNSYVNGNLQRAFASNTDTYAFPVGTSTMYTLAEVVNNNLVGINYIDSKFLSSYTSTGSLDPLKAVDFGTPYVDIAPEGIWYLEPDAQPTSGNYTIKLHFDDGGGANAFSGLTDNKFGPLKRDVTSTLASDWTALNGTLNANDGTGRMVADGFAQRNGINSFSHFAIGRSDFQLPIELLDFNIKMINNNAYLNWITSSELNNNYFEIEKSKDATNFKTIGKVLGAGNSSINLSYSYIDKYPFIGESYYRLKQTDFDGNFSYSNILSVNNKNKNSSIIIYNKILEIKIPDEEFKLQIYNTTGELIISKFYNNSYAKLDLSNLKNGIYFVKIYSNISTYSQKIILK